MKKILFGLVALSSLAMAYEMPNVYIRAGVDAGRFTELKDEDTTIFKKAPDRVGFEFAVEATEEIVPNFELGLGLAYQSRTKGKKAATPSDWTDEEFDEFHNSFPDLRSVPVYLTGRYYFPLESAWKPYVKADLGYSFNGLDKTTYKYTDEGVDYKETLKYKNGLYCGLGAGVEYNNVTFDIMYKLTKTKLEYSDNEGAEREKADYSALTFSVGYKF